MESHLNSCLQDAVHPEEGLSIRQLFKLVQHSQNNFFLQIKLSKKALDRQRHVQLLVLELFGFIKINKLYLFLVRLRVEVLYLGLVGEVLNKL